MNWNELRKTILQAIALVGLNGLAFFYDNSFVSVAIGIDAIVLGVEVGLNYTTKREQKPQV